MSLYFLYPLIGLIAGLLSGLLGIGGGIVVVPGLLLAFALSGFPHAVLMHIAVGTSLAVMIFTAISSILAHHYRGNVNFLIISRFLPSILVGVILGALLAKHLPTEILQILFGIFLLFVSIQLFLLAKPKPTRQLPGILILSLVGFLIGLKSGLLGIGGGSIIIPFLIYCNVPMRQASGTSVSCTLPIAIIGSLSFMFMGWHTLPVAHTIGFIYWPAFLVVGAMSVLFAPIGAWLGGRLDTNLLKRIFAVFLFFVSIRLLW